MDARDRYLSTTQGGYSQPAPPPVSTGTPNFSQPGQGGNNLPPVVPTIPVEAPNIIQQGIGSLGGSLHGDEIYQPEIRNNYDVLDAMTDLSIIHGQTSLPGAAGQNNLTKYGKSWDFNPANPDNLIGYDTHTLGNMIAVDSDGQPILDSEGKPIFTSFGKSLYDHMYDEGFVGQNQSVPNPSVFQDYIDTFSFDELQDWERDYFDQNWYGSDNWDDFLDQPYYGPLESLALSDPKFWKQTSLSELDPTGFADREMIYGEELGNQMATPGAWLVQPFGSEVVEGV